MYFVRCKSATGVLGVEIVQLTQVKPDVWKHELLGYYNEYGQVITVFTKPVSYGLKEADSKRLDAVVDYCKKLYLENLK